MDDKQLYLDSMDVWFKDMDLTMEQTRNAIEFHGKEIVLHHKHLDVLRQQLAHDEARYALAKKTAEEISQSSE